ncbi:hypothetical protein [Aureimonas altamirensis]|uniref:hypothetical protein n=1 Tax=Aureimonas altamirensis TaxID=370622 RepID=UPI0030165EFC
MKLYQTDYQGDGRFIGEVMADPNPMREGDWLIPAGAVEAAPPEAEEPAYARWIGHGWEVHTPPPPEPEPEPEPLESGVPTSVTIRQAKLQMSRAGILSAVDAAIAGMEGQAGEEARIEWQYATELRRAHPLVEALGPTLGLSDEAIDALFVEAAKIA